MTQPLTPTQADRQTFKELVGRFGPYAERVDAGDEDGDWRMQLIARHAQAARLEGVREVERLREALEPFATALDDWGDDTGQPDRWTAWEHPIAMNVTLGDFRRARASLDPLSIAEKGV